MSGGKMLPIGAPSRKQLVDNILDELECDRLMDSFCITPKLQVDFLIQPVFNPYSNKWNVGDDVVTSVCIADVPHKTIAKFLEEIYLERRREEEKRAEEIWAEKEKEKVEQAKARKSKKAKARWRRKHPKKKHSKRRIPGEPPSISPERRKEIIRARKYHEKFD